MKGLVSVVAMASVMGLTGVGTARAEAWVQIEAKSSLAQAEARARDWAGLFPETTGHALRSGWYAIALGPFPTGAEARERLSVLLREGLIPRDSYVVEGGRYGQQFWPVGAGLTTAPAATAMPEPMAPGIAAPDVAAPEATEAPATATAEPAPAPQPEPEPVETLAEARRLEAALDRDTRRAIQSALEWDGFYSSAIDGVFGRGTRAAIAAWQAARGHEATGVLAPAQQAQLLEGVARARAELGLETVEETEAGIAIDLPLGLVRFDRYDAPFVSYAARDGSGVQVLLISQQGDQTTLFGLYDAMQRLEIVPVEGARERGRTSFTLTGQNARISSYTQAELKGGLIKGFTLVWPTGDEARRDRVLEAMKRSFRPLGDKALDATMGQPMQVTHAALMAGLETHRPVFSRSGFFIDAKGAVATAAEGLAECGRITIEDHDADLAFADTGAGVAVLIARDALVPASVAQFQTLSPPPGVEIAVAGFSYPETLSAPVLTFGTFSAPEGLAGETTQARLAARTLAGDAGGPVLDPTGSVVAMLLPAHAPDGKLLPDDLSVGLRAPEIARVLSENGFAPKASQASGSRAAEDLQIIADGLAVQISCWN